MTSLIFLKDHACNVRDRDESGKVVEFKRTFRKGDQASLPFLPARDLIKQGVATYRNPPPAPAAPSAGPDHAAAAAKARDEADAAKQQVADKDAEIARLKAALEDATKKPGK